MWRLIGWALCGVTVIGAMTCVLVSGVSIGRAQALGGSADLTPWLFAAPLICMSTAVAYRLGQKNPAP